MSFVFSLILQCKKMLTNLRAGSSWAASARQGPKPSIQRCCSACASLPISILRQVQSSCDNAKLLAARSSGKEAPKHLDTEQTVDEVRARIRTCVSHLDTFAAADFKGAESRLWSCRSCAAR